MAPAEAKEPTGSAAADHAQAEILLDQAKALGYKNNRKAAIALLDRAIKLDPEFWLAYFNRALYRNFENDMKGSIADNTKVIEHDPPHAAYAAFNRAEDYFELRRNTEAIADFTRAIELQPANSKSFAASAYEGRALCHISLGHKRDAQQDLSMSISLDPSTNSISRKSITAWIKRSSPDLITENAVFTLSEALNKLWKPRPTISTNAR